VLVFSATRRSWAFWQNKFRIFLLVKLWNLFISKDIWRNYLLYQLKRIFEAVAPEEKVPSFWLKRVSLATGSERLSIHFLNFYSWNLQKVDDLIWAQLGATRRKGNQCYEELFHAEPNSWTQGKLLNLVPVDDDKLQQYYCLLVLTCCWFLVCTWIWGSIFDCYTGRFKCWP